MERIARDTQYAPRSPRKAPVPPAPHVLLALQRTAGNAAVARLLARAPATEEKPPLRDYEVPDEIAELRRIGLSDASIRTVQMLLGTDLTGEFTPADAQELARLHAKHGLKRGAWIGKGTLDVLVKLAATRQMEEEAIHLVADYDKLGSDVLSIHFSPALLVPSSTTFDPAGMRFIGVGPSALASAAALRRALRDALTRASPSHGAGPVVPSVLTPKEEADAVKNSRYSLRDTRAMTAVQHAVRAPLTGFLDEDTAQALAAFQQAKGIAPADGVLNDDTFNAIVTQLAGGFGEEAAIRLVIDYRGISEWGVMDVSFDPALPSGTEVEIRTLATRAAASIAFGPALFGQPVERIVHRIARAFTDVELRHRGVAATDRRRFLLERLTMLSPGMPEEQFTPFMADAVQALAAFKDLDAAGQAALSGEFKEVRDKLRERWAQAPQQLQQSFQQTFDEYMALQLP